MTARRVGVALTGHWLGLDATRRLSERADALGFDPILVDGDETALPARKDARLYDGDVLVATVLAATHSARVGAIRLPGFENAAVVARGLATLQEASAGRALGFFGVGSGRHAARLGLPEWSAGERVRALDETLDAVRALLSGEEVTRQGRFVRLVEARAAQSAQPVPIVVAAVGPRALRVVAERADVWDANVPPLRDSLDAARQRLGRRMETWIWVFARPGASLEDAGAEYRRICPWFGRVPETALADALLYGDPGDWPQRLDDLAGRLEVDVPIVDLAGLGEDPARRAIDALGPARATGIS